MIIQPVAIGVCSVILVLLARRSLDDERRVWLHAGAGFLICAVVMSWGLTLDDDRPPEWALIMGGFYALVNLAVFFPLRKSLARAIAGRKEDE